MAAAAPSSSDSVPRWTILNRVAHVWDDAEEEEPDEVAVKMSCSPTFSTLSVARSVHPDYENYDRHPYIVAYDDGGLLLHISTSPSIGLNLRPNPAGSFLVLPVGGFVPAIADTFVMPAAAAVRVPERLNMPSVASIKSVGFLSRLGTRGIEYLVAELQSVNDPDGSTANLIRFRSGSDTWVEERLRCIGFNPRCTDEVISYDGRLWWVDLGKGMVSCKPFEDQPVLLYQDLPRGVARRDERCPEWARNDTEKKRCLTVSNGMLRFLELREMVVIMWTLVSDPEDGSTSWIREYKIVLSKISQEYSDKSTLPPEMLVLAIVHPEKAEMVYLFVNGRLVSLDVTEQKIEEVITNFSPISLVDAWDGEFAPPPLSWRYVILWELSISGNYENEDETSALSADARGRRSLTRLCWQGVKLGQIMATRLGVNVSSLGSNLHYLNQECSDAKLFFKHVSEYKGTGHGYVASATGKSAKASKAISRVLGRASNVLSYGGTALNTVGFSLQRLHPQAQTGASARNAITEMITVESVKQAEDLIQEWRISEEIVIVDVPPEMERELAERILKLFKDAGALVLVENSPVLREIAERVLDFGSDWHIL